MTLAGGLRYLWAAPATGLGLALAALAGALGATVRVSDGVLEVAGGRLERLGGSGGLAMLGSLAPQVGRLAGVRTPAGSAGLADSEGADGGGFVAITFGHVVIGQSHAVLAGLRVHEHEHVRQYERWGVLFFAAYLGSSAIQWLRGRDPYRDNRFERQARAAERAARLWRINGATTAPDQR